MATDAVYGEQVQWEPAKPRLRPVRLAVSWIVSAAAVWVAAWLVQGVSLDRAGAAFVAAALIAILNAVLPPLLAALRLPFALLSGFLLVLFADAAILRIASSLVPSDIHVSSFGSALL